MFTIERKSEEHWVPEIAYRTEIKAFVQARSRCMATGQTYRVVDREQDVAAVVTPEICNLIYGRSI